MPFAQAMMCANNSLDDSKARDDAMKNKSPYQPFTKIWQSAYLNSLIFANIKTKQYPLCF